MSHEQLGPLRVGVPDVPDRMTQDRAPVRREIQSRLRLAALRAGVDFRYLLADDALADQSAHASHNRRRYAGMSTLDFR